MTRLAAKLAFIHRTLWQRDPAYRWAVLLGPPPLLGCAVAALAWAMLRHIPTPAPPPAPGSDAPWAHWTRPIAQDSQPFTEAPTAPLPPRDDANGFVGYRTGWVGFILPMTVDATRDANVLSTVLGNFTLDQPAISLSRILDAGPPTGLFVGGEKTFFVVPSPGLYAFSARLTRTGTQSADCLVRLSSPHHRMLRNITLNTAGDAVLTYPPTEFHLQPGLLLVSIAVGCWRGDHMVAPGEMTLMVRHPGDAALHPAAANEGIRPAHLAANRANAESPPTTHSLTLGQGAASAPARGLPRPP
jgi:hypothetical protein